MKLIPTLALLLLTTLPSLARLGETKAQCEARYGKPVDTSASGEVTYQKGGMNILITYWKDKAARISFSNDDPKEPGYILDQRTPLTKDQIDTLLKASAGDSTWKKDNGLTSTWTRLSDQSLAIYSTEGKDLTLHDIAYVEHQEKEKEKEKDKDKKATEALKNFGGLGETRAECDKRYGKPIDEEDDEIYYQKDGVLILVNLWNGKAGCIIFSRTAPEDSDTNPSLTEADQSTLLQANAGGFQWKKDEVNAELGNYVELGSYGWHRSDGKARATYEIEAAYLMIGTSDYLTHLEKAGEKEKP